VSEVPRGIVGLGGGFSKREISVDRRYLRRAVRISSLTAIMQRSLFLSCGSFGKNCRETQTKTERENIIVDKISSGKEKKVDNGTST